MAHHKLHLSDEISLSDKVLLNLGPATVVSGGSLDVTVGPPAAEAAATAPAPSLRTVGGRRALVQLPEVHWLIAVTGFGGWLGEQFGGHTGAFIGAVVGYVWAARRWSDSQRGPE